MSANRPILRYLGLLSMSLLFFACSQNNTPEAEQTIRLKEDTMQLSSIENASSRIPPIDAAAPKIFQTATFGLG